MYEKYYVYEDDIIDIYLDKGLNEVLEFSGTKDVPLLAVFDILQHHFGCYEEDIDRLGSFYEQHV